MLFVNLEITDEFTFTYNMENNFEKIIDDSKISREQFEDALSKLDKFSYHFENGILKIHNKKNAEIFHEAITKQMSEYKDFCYFVMMSKDCYRFEDDEFDYSLYDNFYDLEPEIQWYDKNLDEHKENQNQFYSINELYGYEDYLKLKEEIEKDLQSNEYYCKELYVGEKNRLYFTDSKDCKLFLLKHKKDLNEKFNANIVAKTLEGKINK